jgi:hypothetical protein
MQTGLRRRRFVGGGLLLLAAACGNTIVHESDADDGELTWLAFDPATVQTLRGEIVELRADKRIAGTERGLRVLLDVGDEQLYVYLAPQSYFDEVKLALVPGEVIEVRGSLLAGDGRRVVIAQTISVGAATYSLRDAQGRPSWRAWRSLPRT